MTLKEIYENVLIEAKKVGTATLHLEDFNYYVNKVINEVINRKYAIYDVNQQTSDDLQVLVRPLRIEKDGTTSGSYTDALGVENINKYKEDGKIFHLPSNYYHLLNCVVNIKVIQAGYKGRALNDIMPFGGTRLTAETEAMVVSNAFLKPAFNRHYYILQDSKYTISESESDNVPKLEVRSGVLSPFFEIDSVDILYLKRPDKLTLTSIQRDTLTDTSGNMEFPEYINFEIIKGVVMYVLENNKDVRLNTFAPLNSDSTQPRIQDQQMPTRNENVRTQKQ